MAKVCIVIVNYNGGKYQNECIRTLKEMTFNDFEIVVIDNASTDDSVMKLQEVYPEVKVIECKSNTGVTGGNNIGIKYSMQSGAEYTVLMNNDIETDPQLLSELLSRASQKTVTVPKIYYYEPSNMLWFAGGQFDWNKGGAHHIGIHEMEESKYDIEKSIDYSPTCCMMIHNSIFKKVGLMDENFFMYYDDADFCARLGQEGIEIRYVPTAKMWHKVSSSTGGEYSKLGTYYMNRNQLYFMKKYKEKISLFAYLFVLGKGFLKVLLSPVRHKNDKYIAQAYIDYKRGKLGKIDYELN